MYESFRVGEFNIGESVSELYRAKIRLGEFKAVHIKILLLWCLLQHVHIIKYYHVTLNEILTTILSNFSKLFNFFCVLVINAC